MSHIPTSKDEFIGGLELMHLSLGANRHALSEFILDIFIDVEKTEKKLPQNLMVFDPENLPFQKEYTCVLLSNLQGEQS